MTERIIHFEVEGKAALGFDTGLSAQAFAQAKLAQFITQEGLIVHSDGEIEPWKPSAVIERQRSDGTPGMVIWGSDFKGERFDLLIKDESRRDEALDALRLWLEVWSSATRLPLWPAGALIDLDAGRILFPPDRLIMRSIQAEGEDAWLDGVESLVNTELRANDAVSFTAGAILYRIMSGTLPFPNRNHDLLHQDIREGVFLPLGLAAPGLDEKITALVDQAIAFSKHAPAGGRPGLEEFREALGKRHSRGVDSFFRTLNEAEQAKIAEEREQLQKKTNIRVNTRRFVIRNAAIITGIFIAVVAVSGVIGSIRKSNAELPTTAGMASAEVVQAYYGAFGDLDHTMMDACVTKKAGRGDIEMVTNLYVMSRVRQAYESIGTTVIPAQKWLDDGAQPTESQIFGVSDLNIRKIRGDESGDEIHYRTSYMLWIPMGADSPDEADPNDVRAEAAPMLPKGYPIADELTLIRHRGNWRIAEIIRENN
ncbi:hypothetical protein FACS1894110_06870 [Spirochaetia bacterium]|nr:hypothetical protein FACS1894110_06870 [Spirochaetia bacterium]